MKSKNMLLKLLSAFTILGFLLTACGAPATATPAATEAPVMTEAPAATNAPAATEAPAGKIYDGVTIDILTFVGPQVAEPLQRRGRRDPRVPPRAGGEHQQPWERPEPRSYGQEVEPIDPGEERAAEPPDGLDLRIGVAVGRRERGPLEAPGIPHPRLERRAGVDLRPAVVERVRGVAPQEVEVRQHRRGRRLHHRRHDGGRSPAQQHRRGPDAARRQYVPDAEVPRHHEVRRQHLQESAIKGTA